MRKVLDRQFKDFSEQDKEKIMKLIEKNPAFFTTLAGAIQIKMNQGKDQMTAIKEVIAENKVDLEKTLSELN